MSTKKDTDTVIDIMKAMGEDRTVLREQQAQIEGLTEDERRELRRMALLNLDNLEGIDFGEIGDEDE